ncbi:MAG: pyridoxal phosphate-dependent aminotransferase [bacterium JZ-2024 1]
MKSYSRALDRLIGEGAFVVLARAKELEAQGRHIIHLEIGEPDFDTPKYIKEACVKYLQDHRYTHYSPSTGIREAREAYAKYVSQTRGIPVSYDEIAITPGAKAIIFASLLALIDIGDEVILPNPSYPSYESAVRFVGAIPRFVPLVEEQGFELDVEYLKKQITSRTKAIVLNSPSNPTGGVLSEQSLKAIAEAAIKHDLWVLSDEIYSEIIYEGTHQSILPIPGMKERTVMVDGFSKTFAMTGWRLGYCVAPADLIGRLSLILNNMFSCANGFVQMSGVDALFGPRDEVRAMVTEFKRRRDDIVDGLNAIPGVHCKKPSGAFYAFPNISSFGKTSKWLAEYLLEEAGVAVLAGTDFGEFGEGYIRLSYANSLENIQEALRRIREALSRL